MDEAGLDANFIPRSGDLGMGTLTMSDPAPARSLTVQSGLLLGGANPSWEHALFLHSPPVDDRYFIYFYLLTGKDISTQVQFGDIAALQSNSVVVVQGQEDQFIVRLL
jgi:hypothetical protein